MHPETPRMNLHGFSHMTSILAFCATKPMNVNGAHRFR
jgi:hypothetical protein